MAMSRQRQREILREDRKRRAARQQIEDAILGIDASEDPLSDAAKIAANNVKGARVNPCLVRGIGTVNPPATTRAHRSTWDRPMRVVGVATGTELTSDGTPTVLVRKPGQKDEIRTVASFRNSERLTHTRKPATIQHVADTAKIELKGMDWSQ